MKTNFVSTQVADETLHLFPEMVVHWPSQNVLFVSDIHLGKSASQRSRSLYIPLGSDEDDLVLLETLVKNTKSEKLIVLGDLFHDSFALSVDTMLTFKSWLKSLGIEVTLIIGNHDRKAVKKIANLPIIIQNQGVSLGPFFLSHEPEIVEGHFTLCGHLHPGVRYRDEAGCFHKAKAFWIGSSQMVLPAFGSTTSMTTISAQKGDMMYVCGDQNLYQMPVR